MSTTTDTRIEEADELVECDFCHTKQADVCEIDHFSVYAVGDEIREDYTAYICMACYRAKEEGDLQI